MWLDVLSNFVSNHLGLVSFSAITILLMFYLLYTIMHPEKF